MAGRGVGGSCRARRAGGDRGRLGFSGLSRGDAHRCEITKGAPSASPCVDLRVPPRHRADAATGTTSLRWRRIATPSHRCSYGSTSRLCSRDAIDASLSTQDLGKKLRKRLEKRGVTVIALHQIRYVGPNEDNRKASHAVYLARADDAMKTSRCSADLVVVAGGEHVQQVQVSARDARSAPRGSTALEVVKATRLDDATRRRPIFVNEELSAGASVLACGDAAATPCRLETTTSALVNTTTHGQRGAVIAVETGTPHAVGTGNAAGRVLATGDGSSAAKVLAGLTPTLAADMRSTLGWHVGFVGKCDAALEAHVFASKSVDVAIYVEKTDLGTGSFRRVPMGVVVVAKNRDLDAAAAADAAAVGLRAHIEPPSPDEHADATYRNDVDFLRGLAAAVAAAAGTDDFSLKHSQVISRADRLGPRYWDGQGAADTALFSRGGKTEMRSKRVAGAFSAQMGKGAAKELDDRRKAQAAIEAGMGRLVQAAKGGDT